MSLIPSLSLQRLLLRQTRRWVEHLLGSEIKAEYLNDDKLGRILDEIYRLGLNRMFVWIGLAVVKKYQLTVKTNHLDSSSFHVHGDYQNSQEPGKSGYGNELTASQIQGDRYR